jgi:hypothetical protein
MWHITSLKRINNNSLFIEKGHSKDMQRYKVHSDFFFEGVGGVLYLCSFCNMADIPTAGPVLL